MQSKLFDHQFLCKLLNIGVNHAIVEGAYVTQDILFNICDLLRYIYDARKEIVPLDEEVSKTKKYIEIQNLKGCTSKTYNLSISFKTCNGFVKHLSLLSSIIEDIEKHIDSERKQICADYTLEYNEGTITLKIFHNNILKKCIPIKNIV